MATLKKTYSHVVRGDHGFTYKLHYPICGFNLEINVNPVSELEFGTVIWDGVSLIPIVEREGRRAFYLR